MELRDYVDMGIKTKGGVNALADYLGIANTSIADAKAHRRGLPNDACVKLARLVGIEPLTVIAASELATEKKSTRREFWISYLNAAKTARVAGITIFIAVVTNFLTPYPAEAAVHKADAGNFLYYVN